MGYLDNSSITVDAILTKKGREILATKNTLGITQFALGDDEIDYTLWNPQHPLGSNYYGIVIENMPLVEAVPDESQHLRSKLITITPTTAGQTIVGIPFVETQTTVPIPPKQITKVATYTITPSTIYFPAGSQVAESTTLNQKLGYTAILSSKTLGTLKVVTAPTGLPVDTDPLLVGNEFFGDASEARTQSVTGLTFSFTPIIPTVKPTTPLKGTITIVGNETGNYDIISFEITKP